MVVTNSLLVNVHRFRVCVCVCRERERERARARARERARTILYQWVVVMKSLLVDVNTFYREHIL